MSEDRSSAGRPDPDLTGERHSRVEVDADGAVVTSAEVTVPSAFEGPVFVTFSAVAGRVPVGSRSDPVDAVSDLPHVRERTLFDATVPLGDAETLQRLDLRTEGMSGHAAGSTARIVAHLPSQD